MSAKVNSKQRQAAYPIYTNANLFFDKKKKGTSANLQPSLHFYGMIFWWEKGSLHRNGIILKLQNLRQTPIWSLKVYQFNACRNIQLRVSSTHGIWYWAQFRSNSSRNIHNCKFSCSECLNRDMSNVEKIFCLFWFPKVPDDAC